MTAAPDNMVLMRISWPGQSTNLVAVGVSNEKGEEEKTLVNAFLPLAHAGVRV